MKNKFSLLTFLLIPFLSFSQNDIFISEYVEGTFNNKAIELYNPTSNNILLQNSGYQLARYPNGSTTPRIINLSGLIPTKGTYVIVLDKTDTTGIGMDTSVFQELQAKADTFVCPNYSVNSMMYFNGDDAVALLKNGNYIDIFGEIGYAPPNQGWSVGSAVWTKDHTMVRKSSVSGGVTTNPLAFTPNNEWELLPANTFDYLGWHITNSSGTINLGNDTVICKDDSLVLDPDLGISAGIPYLWTFNGDTIPGNPSTLTIDTNGQYTVEVTGLSLFDTINITISANDTTYDSLSICKYDSILLGGAYQNTAGTYYNLLTSMYGCDSIVETNLNITNIDTSITKTGIQLTANLTTGIYQWLNCNNNFAVISGETNASYTPSIIGSYAVEITENNCTDTSSCYVISKVGINENFSDKNTIIFPNPTTGKVNIQLGQKQNNVRIFVSNLLGEIIYTGRYNSVEHICFNLDGEPGLYFIKIEGKHGIITTKKVVKK